MVGNDTADSIYQHIEDFLKQSKALFQNHCLLPMALLYSEMHNVIEVASNRRVNRVNYELIHEGNREEWENYREGLRWSQLSLNLARKITNYLQKQLDIMANQELTKTLPMDIVVERASIREAFDILEPRIAQVTFHIEWRLQSNSDYMARVRLTPTFFFILENGSNLEVCVRFRAN